MSVDEEEIRHLAAKLAKNSVDSYVQNLEEACKRFHEAVTGSEWSKRIAVASPFGYMYAKHMVYMMQTMGFPLWAYIDQVRKSGLLELKIPYKGLRHELLRIGKKESSIDSMLRELAE